MNNEHKDIYSALYNKCHKALFLYAYQHTGDKYFSEDAVQDAFLWAIVKYDQFSTCAAPQGWLFKTLRNIIGNELQRKRRQSSVKLDDTIPGKNEFKESITELVPSSMSQKDKNILFLRYAQCYSFDNIAQILDVSAATCRKRVNRAIMQCRKMIAC